MALPIYNEKYLNAKRRIYGNSNNFTMQKYNLPKIPLKETKILQDIITLVTNLKFSTQAKISSFKNPHIKIDLLLLPSRGL
jgi:hypothetical protein